MRHYNIPIFVPHLGCPHDCVFCNQKKITGISGSLSANDVTKIIENHISTINTKDAYIEVAFFGGSFTAIDFDVQVSLLKAAYLFVEKGYIHGIRCSTRPDAIDKPILENLKRYGVTTIELGVQSTDNGVLDLSGRGHDRECVFASSALIKEHGFDLGLQMMLGLPGDSFEKIKKTACDFIKINPKCVRIYPTLVMVDTYLYKMYSDGLFTPMTLDDTVDICAYLIKEFGKNNIDVIRLGLQTTDNINNGTVIGPFHYALRELAEGKLIRDELKRYFDIEKISNEVIEIVANGRNISKIVGHKRENYNYFIKEYKTTLKVHTDKDMPLDTINIKNTKALLRFI